MQEIRFSIIGFFFALRCIDFIAADPQEGLAKTLSLDIFNRHFVDLFFEGLFLCLFVGSRERSEVGLLESRCHSGVIFLNIFLSELINN